MNGYRALSRLTSLRISPFPPAFCISDKLFWKIPGRPRLMPGSLRGWPRFRSQGQFSWVFTSGNWCYSSLASPRHEYFSVKSHSPRSVMPSEYAPDISENLQFCKFKNEARPSKNCFSHNSFCLMLTSFNKRGTENRGMKLRGQTQAESKWAVCFPLGFLGVFGQPLRLGTVKPRAFTTHAARGLPAARGLCQRTHLEKFCPNDSLVLTFAECVLTWGYRGVLHPNTAAL